MTDEDTTDPVDVPTRVVAAVVRQGETWLVCQRASEKRHGDLWEFPGGKVEPGEDDTTALQRELEEELAVTVRRVGPPLFAVRDPQSVYLIVFREVEIEGSPMPREHSAVRWASLDTIRQLALAPSDRRFVDLLDNLPRDTDEPGAVL
jgi:8-oxo-dGTP diphosphatase